MTKKSLKKTIKKEKTPKKSSPKKSIIKKEKTPPSTLSKGFLDLANALAKISPDCETLENSSYARISEWIPTGSYIFNACLSGSLFGGMPNNRSLCFAGEEGCLQKNEEVEIYIIKNPKISQHHELKKE